MTTIRLFQVIVPIVVLEIWVTTTSLLQSNSNNVVAFVFQHRTGRNTNIYKSSSSSSQRFVKKPERLVDNVEGVVYVNDKCINCAACSFFAPETFQRSTNKNGLAYHIVYQQPQTKIQIEYARAALAACPVAAIRLDSSISNRKTKSHTTMEVQGNTNVVVVDETNDSLLEQMSLRPGSVPPFPRPFLNDESTGVFWLGHHNDRSFGATPYLFQSRSTKYETVWIMVDTPKFSQSSIRAVLTATGGVSPDYLVLSHVDDTADHNLWKEHFPKLKRVFHSGDLGRYNWIGDSTLEAVEVLLPVVQPEIETNLVAYNLEGNVVDLDEWKANDASGDVIILHTPGHSPGSITLYRRPIYQPKNSSPGVLFTGDTYAYTTRDGGRMTSFPRYGNNHSMQANTLKKLVSTQLDWHIIAPGHGHARDYRCMESSSERLSLQQKEMQNAIQELIR